MRNIAFYKQDPMPNNKLFLKKFFDITIKTEINLNLFNIDGAGKSLKNEIAFSNAILSIRNIHTGLSISL